MRGDVLHGRWRHWMLLGLYRAAFTLAIFLFVIVFPLWIFSAKRRVTLFKRLGWQPYPQSKPSSGKPVWIHALSIGELLSAGSLIQSLRRELGDRPLYLSVSTASAFAMAQDRFSRFCDGMFYFPYDVTFAVDRCLDAVDPALIVLVETDIWPGFLDDVRRRRIPCVLVNGRLSPDSFRLYRGLRLLFQSSFNTFDGIYPQSAGEAERFLAVGVAPDRAAPSRQSEIRCGRVGPRSHCRGGSSTGILCLSRFAHPDSRQHPSWRGGDRPLLLSPASEAAFPPFG